VSIENKSSEEDIQEEESRRSSGSATFEAKEKRLSEIQNLPSQTESDEVVSDVGAE
jgi:hypothetical protein